MKRAWLSLAVVVAVLAPEVARADVPETYPEAAASVSRIDAVTRGRQFARHRWSATALNINPTRCPAGIDWYPSAAGTQTYQQVSFHYVGDFIGLPYNWGGRMTLRQFDMRAAQGYGAGAAPSAAVEDPDCTMGVDCSGFVSTVWRKSGPVTTTSMPSITSSVTVGQMLAGDVWNDPGYHVAMFTQTLANGIPESVESVGYNVNINRNGGYGAVQGFSPRRYEGITGNETGVPLAEGTLESPIVIPANGTTSVDTRTATQSVYSRYGCTGAEAIKEDGPEVVLQVTFDRPGTFTATIADDATGDLDVHVLSQLNTDACVARHDKSATTPVGCGTYYVLVDTFNTAANVGLGDLTTTFVPSGAECGGAIDPAPFEAKGALGAECNANTWCDINQGGEACLRTSETNGFCSAACSSNADCVGMAGGDGCCGDVTVTDSEGNERTEKYCYVASMCDGGQATSSGATTGSSGNGSNGGSGRPGSSNGGSGDDDGDDDGTGGDDDGTGKGNGEGNNADGESSSGGCSATPGASSAGGMLLLGVLGLTALSTRRRSRR